MDEIMNGGGQCLDDAKAALMARALCGDAGDHRLATYRTSAGDLMCLASAGRLISETPIDPAICGAAEGCAGMWNCLIIQSN